MIKVIDPGFYTSVQDVGRLYFKELGIPESGCMDRLSGMKANALLGNEKEDAVLEITMTGPVLEFTESTYIALCGAEFDFFIDNEAMERESALEIHAGQTLTFGKLHQGFRAYLAVLGGIQSEVVFGSRSYFKSLTEKQRLEKRDQLLLKKEVSFSISRSQHIIENTPLESKVMHVFEGPEYDLLSARQKEILFQTAFEASHRNNRMAYQFEPFLDPAVHSVITCPVLPGTIQLTPKGSLFALMRDGQTTGGYPRVLQLTQGSINALAQLREGNFFRFILADR
jgi:5-oxoprolinase (ATP-hydrolysing) subunit C